MSQSPAEDAPGNQEFGGMFAMPCTLGVRAKLGKYAQERMDMDDADYLTSTVRHFFGPWHTGKPPKDETPEQADKRQQTRSDVELWKKRIYRARISWLAGDLSGYEDTVGRVRKPGGD